MNKLRLVLAGAVVAGVLTPVAASAGWQCSLQWRDQNVGGTPVSTPYCVW